MSALRSNRIKKNRLSAAVFAAILLPCAPAIAQEAAADEGQTETKQEQATNLEKIVVTGSLIPQTELETSNPVLIIDAEDIHSRGYTSVADILQQNSFASGGIQGGETSASFTQGAEAVSMFGLDPGYTKYLIDGRPMANYPALYNGSDVFNAIQGIPIDLVDRVEILPGGASSLYGSDAMAGVVNIILKKQMDGAILRIRGGGYSDGGGSNFRVSLAKGFNSEDGRLSAVFGAQYEERDPIWGYQRDLTDSINQDGYSAATAPRDYLVYGYTQLSDFGFGNYGYVLPDAAADCANVASQFNGTEELQFRPGYGYYCGSMLSPGWRTIRNGKESGQIYGHVTFDINDNVQLYADALYSHDATRYSAGSNYTWWGTGIKYGYFYDPDYDGFINLQRVFTPEDIGGLGYGDIMDKVTNKSYQVAFGLRGMFGENWDYDLSFARNESKYTSRGWVRWADAINAYFEDTVLGPQLGVDPYYNYYPVFQPDYAAFYSTNLTPEDFASFTGYAISKAKTWDDVFRAQLTNSNLFSLPGGDAGLAVAIEAGNEGWDYQPNPGYLNGDVWGTTDVAGAAHRTRYAAMSELRLPFFDMLTASLSARYDAFDAYGVKVDKPTWSAGLEFRPFDSLLLRGKYGTAFKAPTLSDTHQGLSGFYSFASDYWRCGLPENGGYDPSDLEGCDYDSVQFFGTQSGNPDLDPINADFWSAGVVFSPLAKLSFSVDYYNWDIRDEVAGLSADDVLLQEYYCRNNLEGGPGVTSCDNALAWVTRGPSGQLLEVYTPKVNIAQQKLEVLAATAKYAQDIGRFGDLAFSLNYTRTLDHTLLPQPTEREIDLLDEPQANWVYDAGPKYKADAAVTWNIGKFSTTVYANQIGPTWNYLAYATDDPTYVHASGAKAGKWGSYTTYNLGLDYAAMDNLTFSVKVNNAFDKTPDDQASNFPGTTSTPYNNYLYSAMGRSFYLEVAYKFGQSE
ncbi:TonB-dependent receptor [Pseudoxanthomonas sangjuensis]|uniref:TonB-dependent receptor plug domain-containing protein n=1 Tax=Pseudoxanthomonas sangjuensis TaxID=1503750 RepID=UPI001391F1C5|nr:TonB-dependent receptor [Pseudoxanthomonas sangjuensis]KAF1715067.1 TonB-dependent receptor [Pseudoxanthomonas sangjuensis]